MAKSNDDNVKSKKTSRPPSSPEAQEALMISLAFDLAEKQLRDGTAKASTIDHFLKMGTEKARLEKEKLRQENELMAAKTEALKSQQRTEEKFDEVIRAMKRYSGNSYDSDEEDIY